MNWSDLYLDHFARHFGKPFDVERYRSESGEALRLATYDQRFHKYRIYASVGLADHADRLRSIAEILLLSDDFRNDVKALFVNTLFFLLQRNIPLQKGIVLGGIEVSNAGFAEFYDKSALYLTVADGFAPGFDTLSRGAETGQVLQGIFVSWAEQDFIARKGADAFEQQYRAQDCDLCSLRRPSCV